MGKNIMLNIRDYKGRASKRHHDHNHESKRTISLRTAKNAKKIAMMHGSFKPELSEDDVSFLKTTRNIELLVACHPTETIRKIKRMNKDIKIAHNESNNVITTIYRNYSLVNLPERDTRIAIRVVDSGIIDGVKAQKLIDETNHYTKDVFRVLDYIAEKRMQNIKELIRGNRNGTRKKNEKIRSRIKNFFNR